MMTRGQVARRLGKSLATVRRLEGLELHPWQDERGVYRFDQDEVERLARGERTREQLPRRQPPLGRAPREAELESSEPASPSGTICACASVSSRHQIRILEERIGALEEQLMIRTQELAEARSAAELARGELEQATLNIHRSLRAELQAAAATLPRRQLRRLLQEDPDLLDDLLNG